MQSFVEVKERLIKFKFNEKPYIYKSFVNFLIIFFAE